MSELVYISLNSNDRFQIPNAPGVFPSKDYIQHEIGWCYRFSSLRKLCCPFWEWKNLKKLRSSWERIYWLWMYRGWEDTGAVDSENETGDKVDTQREAGRKAGISRSSLCRWRKGFKSEPWSLVVRPRAAYADMGQQRRRCSLFSAPV